MKTNNKKILIVGAGIAGLALAAMCEKRSIAYDLVEKSTQSHPQGYSITIPPAGLDALRTLGIYDEVYRLGSSVKGVLLAASENRTIDFGKSNLNVMTMKRADLHAALLTQVKQAIQYDTTLDFNDPPGGYDIIVGADGVRSQVRTQILPNAKPQSTGVAFWTCFVPEDLYERFSTSHITQYWRGGNFAGIFPLPKGASIVLSSHLDPSVDLLDVDITRMFTAISDDLDDVLLSLDQKTLYRGHLQEVRLTRWQKYPYVLIGDAAHAMMPATGMGSTAGILDAITLTDMLVRHDDWQEALEVYESSRISSARNTQTTSRLITSAMLATGMRGSFNQKAAQLLPDGFFAQIFR